MEFFRAQKLGGILLQIVPLFDLVDPPLFVK